MSTYSSMIASIASQTVANSSTMKRRPTLVTNRSAFRAVSALLMARLSGKNWYSEPMATPARCAIRVVDSAS
jgi:hypothetical protein